MMFSGDGIGAGSRRRFGVPAALSLGLHLVAAAAVPTVIAPRPAPIPRPESVFVLLRPRPPTAAAAPAERSSPVARPPKPKRKVAPPAVLTAPAVLPPYPAPEEPAPEPRTASPPPEERPRPDGLPGGLGNAGASTAGALVLATNAEGHVEYDDALMTPPERLSGPDPEYTYLARVHEVQGLMIVKCVVTILGVVRDCRVLQGLPYMEGAVVDALLRRRYTPARLADGRAVEVDYTFRIRLRLVGPVKLP
jgi:periplasmic protein TonB